MRVTGPSLRRRFVRRERNQRRRIVQRDADSDADSDSDDEAPARPAVRPSPSTSSRTGSGLKLEVATGTNAGFAALPTLPPLPASSVPTVTFGADTAVPAAEVESESEESDVGGIESESEDSDDEGIEPPPSSVVATSTIPTPAPTLSSLTPPPSVTTTTSLPPPPPATTSTSVAPPPVVTSSSTLSVVLGAPITSTKAPPSSTSTVSTTTSSASTSKSSTTSSAASTTSSKAQSSSAASSSSTASSSVASSSAAASTTSQPQTTVPVVELPTFTPPTATTTFAVAAPDITSSSPGPTQTNASGQALADVNVQDQGLVSSQQPSNGGAIAGIVIGVLALVGILAFFLLWLTRRRRRLNGDPPSSSKSFKFPSLPAFSFPGGYSFSGRTRLSSTSGTTWGGPLWGAASSTGGRSTVGRRTMMSEAPPMPAFPAHLQNPTAPNFLSVPGAAAQRPNDRLSRSSTDIMDSMMQAAYAAESGRNFNDMERNAGAQSQSEDGTQWPSGAYANEKEAGYYGQSQPQYQPYSSGAMDEKAAEKWRDDRAYAMLMGREVGAPLTPAPAARGFGNGGGPPVLPPMPVTPVEKKPVSNWLAGLVTPRTSRLGAPPLSPLRPPMPGFGNNGGKGGKRDTVTTATESSIDGWYR
ncbi:hypothetical protein B0T17DRAFT_600773 [Bombardia bombarda]|uniref:Uncharacterized protein n=1 Tax=Bombardia bombarda TaxID=252184 RepID=A0AA39WV05_9PEZI|nr:hypothetical protein B0T17DRAFT_600773 [Bombardia bombarda]